MNGQRIGRSIWIHLSAWAIFIGYEVCIALLWDTHSPYYEFACYYLLDVILFYTNAKIISKIKENDMNFFDQLIPILLVEIAVFTLLSLALGVLLYKIEHQWAFYAISTKDCAKGIWRGVYIAGLSSGYAFFTREIRVTKERNAIRMMQLETERKMMVSQNGYLRSQINRHLLFNTLNFIYSSVLQGAPEAGKSVLLLSETMHYALQEHANSMASLADEVGQIERYIELNRLRFSNGLKLVFIKELTDGYEGIFVPPLLLLTFVENIFKHGDLTSYETDAKIYVCCNDTELSLYTRNYKKGWQLPVIRTHIGISNAQTRLELFYGQDNFKLDLQETNDEYIVNLTIRI